MKKNKTKKNSKAFKVAALCLFLSCGSVTTAFAATDGGGNDIAALIALINEIYNNTIKFVTDTIYAFDPVATDLSTANNNIVNTNEGVANASRNTMDNLVKYYLTGEEVKAEDSKNLVKQTFKDIQNDISVSAIKTYDDVFKTSTDFAKDESGVAPQYSVNSLLAPIQYDNTQLSNAQTFIRNVETLAELPTVIRVSKDFVIPYSPKSNQYTTHITTKNTALINQIQTDLQNDKTYLSYILNVHKDVTARSIYMDTIASAYQDRVSYNGKPSAASLDYAEATMRLKDDSPNSYYTQMQTVPPSVVARESLFLLAEIHHDLYLIRQQNERMMVLQSLSGMQTASFTSLLNKANVTSVAKKIYCEVYPTDSACTTSTSGSPAGGLMNQMQQIIPK